MKAEHLDWVKYFKAFSDATRLRIVLSLQLYSGLCVCELVDALDLPQYAISRHLGMLRKSELVTTEKQGLWVYYSLKDIPPILTQTLEEIMKSEDSPLKERDILRLKDRLELRKDGRCVVGFSSDY